MADDNQPDDGLNMAALLAAMGAASASPTEAPADARVFGTHLYGLATGLIDAGFATEQAVYLLGQMLHGGALGGAIAAAITGGESS